MFRVIKSIRIQRWGQCNGLIIGLLRSKRASMCPQDWAPITFRQEIHSIGHNNESGRWLENTQTARSGNLVIILMMSHVSSCFQHPLLFTLTLAFKVFLNKEFEYENGVRN